jgi:hypothetical protein
MRRIDLKLGPQESKGGSRNGMKVVGHDTKFEIKTTTKGKGGASVAGSGRGNDDTKFEIKATSKGKGGV